MSPKLFAHVLPEEYRGQIFRDPAMPMPNFAPWQFLATGSHCHPLPRGRTLDRVSAWSAILREPLTVFR